MLLSQEAICASKPTVAVQAQKFLSLHRVKNFEQIALFTPKTGAEFTNVAWNPNGLIEILHIFMFLHVHPYARILSVLLSG